MGAKWVVLTVILCCSAYAAIIEADTCSKNDVQAALNAAVDGDTISVPAGTCTYTSGIVVNKAVSIIGAGTDKTTITDNAGKESAFSLQSEGFNRLSGIKFKGSFSDYRGVLKISNNARVDHCIFELSLDRHPIYVHGTRDMVIDNCEFSGSSRGINVFGSRSYWDDPSQYAPGTAYGVYIEDCTFNRGGVEVVDMQYGGAYVVRHSTIKNGGNLAVHGADSGDRSGGYVEIYDNNFVNPGTNKDMCVILRGGTAYIYNNDITGPFNSAFKVQYWRSCYGAGSENLPFHSDNRNRCMHNSANPLDGDYSSPGNGWPCKDQPGTGPNHMSTPMYQWNNTWDKGTAQFALHNVGGCSNPSINDHVVSGRDYFNNQQPAGYQPLVYPHPLRGAPQIVCSTDSQCSDDNSCTSDICLNPGQADSRCENNPITCSIISDDCCPAGCDYTTDADCQGPGALYVDQDHPQAADSSSNGDENHPYETINYAIGQAGAGDTIIVKATTSPYDISSIFVNNVDGSNAEPITLKGGTGSRPHIRGAGSADWGWIKFTDASNWIIEDLEISNLGMAFEFRNSHGIIVRNNYLHDSINQLVSVVDNSYDILFEDNILENGGSIFYDPRNRYENGEGFYLGVHNGGDFVHDIVIRGNTIKNMQHDCIELKADVHDVIIENNILDSCMMNEHCSSADGWVQCYGNAAIHINSLVQYNQNPNNIIRGNIIKNQNNRVTGVAIDLSSGADVYNNLIYGLSSDEKGIEIASAYTPRIYHNTIDVPASRAIIGTGDIKNNIGPSNTDNLATGNFFASAQDYHLKSGAAPINAGVILGAEYNIDFDGNSRDSEPDMGAYEYTSACITMTITELASIIEQWKNGETLINQVMQSIVRWKSGC